MTTAVQEGTILAVLLLLFLVRRTPVWLLAIYLISVCFVPYWVALPIGETNVPAALVWTAGAVAFVGFRRFPMRSTDVYVIALFMLPAVGVLLDVVLVNQWYAYCWPMTFAYFLGRAIGTQADQVKASQVFVIIGVLLATFSITEFLLNWHPFQGLIDLPGQGEIWASIQYRGTLPRSEGAMGHSISLGSVIAMTSPFVIHQNWSGIRRILVSALMLTGTCLTMSRSAVITFAIAIGAGVLFDRSGKVTRSGRITGVIALAAGVTIFSPWYLTFIADSTNVLQDSFLYRANYTSVISDVRWFGLSDIHVEYSQGMWGWESSLYPGGIIVTLDNTPLLTALQFGWVVCLVLLLMFFDAIIKLMRHPKRPAELFAVAGQLFGIFTVAMITQIPYILFLLLGMGISRSREFSSDNAELSRKSADGRTRVDASTESESLPDRARTTSQDKPC